MKWHSWLCISNADLVEVIRAGAHPSECFCAGKQNLTAHYICWTPPRMKPLISLPEIDMINNCYNCLPFTSTSKWIFFSEILIKFYINYKCTASFFQQKSLLGISAVFHFEDLVLVQLLRPVLLRATILFDSLIKYPEISFFLQDLKSLIRFVFLKAKTVSWESWGDILFSIRGILHQLKSIRNTGRRGFICAWEVCCY